MRPVPGALVRIKQLDTEVMNRDVVVRDARTKERQFLPVGTVALVIGYLEDTGLEPDAYIFVPNMGFYRTLSAYLEAIWSG